MTAPGCGGADEIREQLAAGLRETYLLPDEDAVAPLTDALLPTVQALIAKGAADAREQAIRPVRILADLLDDDMRALGYTDGHPAAAVIRTVLDDTP